MLKICLGVFDVRTKIEEKQNLEKVMIIQQIQNFLNLSIL